VRLLGFRRDTRALMCAFDIFALTSRYEGLPYAVLEAMALGLPTVATDVAGTRDVVVSGVTGLLVAPGDSAAVAKALLTLVGDEKQRAAMGERGRTRVADGFTLARMARRLEGVYVRVAGGG
jgi:glycosyltransferase involved in cell wall biosynthesis